jgi:hypothetical protein
MTLSEMRRQHLRWLIAQNPTVITIQRIEKLERNGGLAEVKTAHGPYTVRIFPASSRVPQEVAGIPGTKQVVRSWALIADDEADIQAGPRVQDQFDAPGLGRFVVRVVYPQIALGERVGLQADLERVS